MYLFITGELFSLMPQLTAAMYRVCLDRLNRAYGFAVNLKKKIDVDDGCSRYKWIAVSQISTKKTSTKRHLAEKEECLVFQGILLSIKLFAYKHDINQLKVITS